MRMRIIPMALAMSSLAAPAAAIAQPLSIEAPPSRPPVAAPSNPIARDLYPQRPPVAQDPHFVAPLSRETDAGRIGVAGWTSQPVPSGSRASVDPDNSGWLGAGFAMEWGRAPKQRQTN